MKLYKNIQEMVDALAWKLPSNYSGPVHPNTIVVAGRCRDSDLMEESNFEAALEMLGGESETVEVIRDRHWACGWVETILVHIDDEKALNIALKIRNDLHEYPLLNEDDFFEREREEVGRILDDNREEFVKEAIKALVAATDVPEDILAVLKSSKSFNTMVDIAFEEACSYSGIENGWICSQSFIKHYLNGTEYGNYANSDLNLMRVELDRAIGLNRGDL